uniref:Kinetochore-associated protein 1 n=1 Tax=Syphacia muris TaxID=451379 RepID=A0A0N5AEV3_9BILA
MLCYKWEEENRPLEDDEVIIDFSCIFEENFLLFVLLTSKGNLRIYYDIPGAGLQSRSVSTSDIASMFCNAAVVCLIPDASGVALVLTNGNVLLIPMSLLIDFPWGHDGILNSDSFVHIEVEVKNQFCLKLPTSAVCYSSLYSKRPVLIYSNKAGQIFVIDLVVRRVSVGLGAPQRLEVTGFTGAQWILPLEEDGLSLRETFSRIVPSELKQISKASVNLSVTADNKLCVLKTEKCRMQQISSFVDLIFEKFDEPLLERCILGIIPSSKSGFFPSCIIVTDKGIVFVRPQGSLDDILVRVASLHNYGLDFCSKIAAKLGQPQLDFCSKIIRRSLYTITSSNAESLHSNALNEITQLAGELPGLEVATAVRMFSEFGVADLLLPLVLGQCDENSSDSCRHFVIKLFISKFKKYPLEKKFIETEIRKFLMKNTDVSEGLEELLTYGFWSSVSLIVKRDERNTDIIGKFLAHMQGDWPTSCVADFVRILSSLCWPRLASYADTLLNRMIEFLPQLKSATHISAFMKVGEQHVDSCCRSGMKLLILSSIKLLAASSSVDRQVLLLSTPLSCGSNCISVVSEDEELIFWGEFSAGTRKARNDEKPKTTSLCSSMEPKTIPMQHRVCSVSCGTEHVLIMTFRGQMYSFGKNRFGQCGVGHCNEVKDSTLIPTCFGVVRSFKAGHYHSALVNTDGKVYTWGWGIHGQLGHIGIDRTFDVLSPKLVKTIKEPVISVACGYAHTVFLTESGTVLTCGNGSYGQLGSGKVERKRFVPCVVGGFMEPVKLISSKYFHVLALTESQKLYQWGASPQTLKMKLFLQKRLRLNKANTESPSGSTIFEKSLESSQSHLSVCNIEHSIADDITFLDAGASHSALITKSGILYTWGKGLEMQLGHGNKKELDKPRPLLSGLMWKSVSCGLDFTAALSSDGSVYVWGRNDKGHLGVGLDSLSLEAREIVLKTDKGTRTLQLSSGSCVSKPQKLPTVISSFASEVAFSEVSIKNFIEKLKAVDVEILRDISASLLRNPIHSTAAVFVHLLAGDITSATKLFLAIRELENSNAKLLESVSLGLHSESECDTTSSAVSSSGECKNDLLCNLLWDIASRHPNHSTQWELLSVILAHFPMGGRILNDRKLRAQAPTVMATSSNLLDGLDATQKLQLIEKWCPQNLDEFVEVAQSDLQKFNSKVRVWSCCGNIDGGGSVTKASSASEKRYLCPFCSEAWREEVRQKFPK